MYKDPYATLRTLLFVIFEPSILSSFRTSASIIRAIIQSQPYCQDLEDDWNTKIDD